jgi:hypothetical protein
LLVSSLESRLDFLKLRHLSNYKAYPKRAALGNGQNRSFSLELIRAPALDSESYSWAVPQCPLAIEYPAAVFEQIRLAVLDAFFAIPRGGLEIGGVLFGRYTDGLLRIEAFRMLDCDHAAGPSFTLSEADHARLRDLLDSAAAEGLHPVGWFRSRTRSEISLSDGDAALHDAYFREPWQVVLVLRLEATRPTRAAFFARVDGLLDSSLAEFVLEPWTCPVPDPGPDPLPEAPVGDLPHIPELKFLTAASAPRSFSRVLWVFALLVGLTGAGLAAHRYLEVKNPAQESFSLEALDRGGQLQLLWDHGARPVRAARRAKLEITDGAAWFSTDLEAAQLQRGSFYYARQTGRVDIHLTVIEPNGRSTDEYASYVGRLPALEAEPQAKPDPAGVKSGSEP